MTSIRLGLRAVLRSSWSSLSAFWAKPDVSMQRQRRRKTMLRWRLWGILLSELIEGELRSSHLSRLHGNLLLGSIKGRVKFKLGSNWTEFQTDLQQISISLISPSVTSFFFKLPYNFILYLIWNKACPCHEILGFVNILFVYIKNASLSQSRRLLQIKCLLFTVSPFVI